ncbi:MAG: hypothetical protein B6D35_04850 [Candidatus Brocadia sp. UTAMX2]|jgi:membrane-bound lytic murein transglycosylase MltF|nr:MAG: hypothetical protein B6D35_04850 [Candidatus Brocadia sp. UTAMX2]
MAGQLIRLLGCIGILALFALCTKAREATPNPSLDVAGRIMQPLTGDYDEMVGRRVIRVLVIFGKTSYFIDHGRQRGITYDAFHEFEKFVNEREKTKSRKIHIVFIPVSRDQLITGLTEGRGDIAAANLTITGGRLDLVDFSDPLVKDVRELVITGPGLPTLTSLDNLSGMEIFVRRSSSYYESLENLNASLKTAGRAGVVITTANENLEDEDLLEMVNSGLIPATVADSHLAEFWRQIFANLRVHENLVLRTGGSIAWAVRKNNPRLKEVLNEFVKGHKKGTTFGNILIKRYLKDTKYLRNVLSPTEIQRFNETAALIRKYADKYAFDWLLIGAQAYQESRLDQSLRSSAGAVGVMQIKPSTAEGHPIDVKHVERLENNINAGVKYLQHIRDQYFDDPGIDPFNRQIFAFAAYNAGPARIAGLRKKATAMGFDKNKWFKNVEIVAAKEIGQETVQYVGNILKYYVAYQRSIAQKELKEHAKAQIETP